MVAALAVGTGPLAAFIVRSARITRPLLDMRLYASRAFAAASVTSFSLGAAVFGGTILMPLYFQVVRGQDVIATGLLLAPSGAGTVLANQLAAPMTDPGWAPARPPWPGACSASPPPSRSSSSAPGPPTCCSAWSW